ncbi:uncharacterized protein LOC124153210 [Ischnura elegans]|uniref:uncharacterized protein LOC124153210 n=1 Tax=Ischnura elegans TaxID=197161 RepID=UPI001ED87D78|nr:uncharacterized protein LOC124153210 [Ischnura elegans]
MPNAMERMSIRAPPFWPEEPSLWFSQLEGQFFLCGITEDESKFWVVATQLEARYAQEVKDIISNPPSENKYSKLKEELIRRLSASREQKIRQLLQREEMGERKPSQFLRHLKNLAGDSVPDEFMRSLWLTRIPQHFRAILAANEGADLDTMASLADKIHEAFARQQDTTPFPPQVSVVSPEPCSCSGGASGTIASLLSRMDDLSRQVAALSVSRPSRGDHSNTHTRQRSRSRGHSLSRRDPNMCWYHWNFGDRARKCIQPCSYSPGNEEGSR